jgi:ParB family chromosome partitioning protein
MTSPAPTATFVELPLDEIDRNPDQPRKHFDPEALAELAASIKANGLLEPIIVRPHAGRYLIVAGERRWRACQLAGKTTAPVLVRDLDEVDAYVLSVTENVNRADMTVMEETEAYAQLQRYGKDVDAIGALFGKTSEYVRVRLSFLDLVPEARALVESGSMGPWLARRVALLQPGNQRVVAARWARGEFDHETAAGEFATALAAAQEQMGFFDMEEPTLEDREEHKKRAKAARSTLDQIEKLASCLTEIAAADPADLAEALGAEVGARVASFEHLAKIAGRARLTMRKAKMHAEARTLVVSEEAISSDTVAITY